MTLDLTALERGVAALRKAVQQTQDMTWVGTLDEDQRRLVRAGVIQHFEFTYELCWKFMRRWLMENVGSVYVEGIPRRQLFRLAAEHRLIEDAGRWFDHHKARNLTTHVYAEPVAEEVYAAAVDFAGDAEALLAALRERRG